MEDSIALLQKLAITKTFRNIILKPLDTPCPKDGDFLDILFARYINPDLEVCTKCKLKSNLANKLLDKLAISLKTTPEEFKNFLKMKYFQRGFKSVIRGIKKYGFQKPFLPLAPLLIIWNFTTLCNLNCKHCYQNAGQKAPDELNFEQQKKVIDKLSDWGITFLAFSGGEPLVQPDFFKLAKYTSDNGIALAVATNGTLISKETANKLKDVGVIYAEVSLDSLDSKFHNELRGGGWDKTIDGIKNLVEVGIPTCMITFMHKDNYKEIPEFVKYAKKLGCTFWAMSEYKPAGRAKDMDIDMSPEQREEALEILSKVTINEIKKNKDKSDFILTDTNAPQFGRKMKEISKKYGFAGHFGFLINNSLLIEVIGGCAAGRAYSALQQNGNITPCIYMPDLVVGNVLSDDLNILWTDNQILKDVRNRDKLEGHCSNCENVYMCGGCRARAYGYLGDVKKSDLGCIYNKKKGFIKV
jgi:radical SAM protein with 4Fe4S-binding SPASM domain